MFLTKKVKCFATKEGVEPVVLKRKTIRRFAPFLIPSAMMFMACTSSTPPKDKEDWQGILDEVVKQNNPDGLMSDNNTIHLYDVPELTDSNFNHLPENVDNFWEIIKNGLSIIENLQKNDSLTEAQKKDYKETAVRMMKQIGRTDDTNEIDLKHPGTLRVFNFMEKVIKFKDKHHEIFNNNPGWIDEQNDFLGRDYLEFEKFLDIAKENPGIAQFAKAFYNDNRRFIITEKDSAQANALSMDILKDWLDKQDIHDKNLWYYDSVKEFEANGEPNHSLNDARYWYSRGKVLGVSLGVDLSGYLGQGLISPRGLIIIHELTHAMEDPVKSGELPYENKLDSVTNRGRPFDHAGELAELGPALVTFALTDQIYKEIHHIPQDHIVNYGFSIKIGKSEIPGGEIAAWTRQMMKKYPDKSISKVLQEKEVYSQINDWGNGKYKSPAKENIQLRELQ